MNEDNLGNILSCKEWRTEEEKRGESRRLSVFEDRQIGMRVRGGFWACLGETLKINIDNEGTGRGRVVTKGRHGVGMGRGKEKGKGEWEEEEEEMFVGSVDSFFSRNVGFSFSYFHFYFRSEEIALEIVDGFRIALQICKLARMLRRHSRGKEESFTVRKKKM